MAKAVETSRFMALFTLSRAFLGTMGDVKKLLIGLLVGLALLPTARALELKTERYTLKNGLTVLLDRKSVV